VQLKNIFQIFLGFIKELIFHPKKSLEQTYPMGWLTILIHYILLMLIGYSALVLYGAFDFNSFIDSWGKGLIYFPILFVLSSMLIWMLLHRPSLKGMAQAWIKGIILEHRFFHLAQAPVCHVILDDLVFRSLVCSDYRRINICIFKVSIDGYKKNQKVRHGSS
jgi:hypothetical protein